MRRSLLAPLMVLLGCGGEVHDTTGDCGPNGECPNGLTCRTVDRKCVPGGQADASPADVLDVGLDPCTKPSNRALSFAGGQVVSVPDSPSLRPEDLTLEAWARLTGSLGSFETIVAKPLGAGNGDSYAIWYEGGRINAGANPSNVATGIGVELAPELGIWHHFAFTFDHATKEQKLYLDGALVASGTTPAVVEYDDHPLLVGADSNSGALNGFFLGDIDEVKLWTSVRDVTEVGLDRRSCTPGSFTGLGGYWPLDEGSGQTTADVSGNGNGGVLGSNSAVEAWDPTWVDSTVAF
jgi:hypothetical protein